MVYCGKPSKGCHLCRERKIRCDQREPTCGQCEKRGSRCPGYRNMVDLSFRDETAHVIGKANKNPPRPHAPRRTSAAARRTSASAKPSPSSTTKSGTASPTGSSPSINTSLFGVLPPRGPFSPLATAHSPKHVNATSSPGPPAKVIRSQSKTPTLNTISPASLEKGTAFFFSRFVTTDSAGYQSYDFIYDVWRPPSSDSQSKVTSHSEQGVDCVTASMVATGLAGLSNLTKCPLTEYEARQCYVLAVNLTRAALRDPEKSIEDTTMLAVLILGTYEFISGRSPYTMKAWKDHINGASALADQRGTQQFKTRAGSRMFLMLCNSVLISCIQSDQPMPQVMVDLRKKQGRVCGLDGPVWRVVDPIYEALQVRHEIKSGLITDFDQIVARLTKVEDEFAKVARELPPGWDYSKLELSRSHDDVFGLECHIYPGLQQATTWNGMRVVRMLLHETLVQHIVNKPIADLTEAHQRSLVTAAKMSRKLAQAVAASVPQYFGIVTSKDLDSQTRLSPQKQPYEIISAPPQLAPRSQVPGVIKREPDTDHDHDHDNNGQLPGSGLRDCSAERFMTLATSSDTIVLPLYTAAASPGCSLEMREYIINRLSAMHRESGWEQARVVAYMLSEHGPAVKWDDIPFEQLSRVDDGDLPSTV